MSHYLYSVQVNGIYNCQGNCFAIINSMGRIMEKSIRERYGLKNENIKNSHIICCNVYIVGRMYSKYRKWSNRFNEVW